MSGFLALARLEIRQRRRVFLGAVLLSAVPFLVPLSRSLHGGPAREAREMTAFLFAAGFAAVLSAVLGWSIVSRDLAEGRLGFFFARPLSSAAIWAGKLGAAFFLACAAAVIVWTPSFLASRGRTTLVELPGWTPWAVVAGAAILVLLFHAAAVALRSRSALLLADAAVLLGGGLVVAASARSLRDRMAWRPLEAGLTVVGTFAVLILLAAGFAAVAQGRLDPRRAHRAASPWIWGGAALGAIAFAAFSLWVRSAGPASLDLDFAGSAPKGTWAVLEGTARGARSGFLLDAATGRYERAGAPWPEWNPWQGWFSPVFSGDGKTAVWFEGVGRGEPYRLVFQRLGAPGSRPQPTSLFLASLPRELVLSEDGRRFASISNHLVSFGELPSGRSLGSARMGTDGWLTGAFVSPGRFRAWEKREQELRIAEFDVDRRALAAPVSIGPFSDFFVFLPDASGSRVLVRDSGAHRTRMRLFDLRDGAARATIFDGPGASATSARFLADGRIVLASTGPGGPSLRLFDAGGSPRPAIALPSARRIQVGGEPAPGVVLVALRDTDVSAPWDAARLLLVDVDRGTARTVATDLAPAGWPFFFGPMAGRSSVSLFYGPGGSLVRFDPITGERRTILAGHGNR